MTGAPGNALLLFVALALLTSAGATGTALNVGYAGCADVTDGPVCALGESRRLTLWLDVGAGSDIDISVDGERILAASELTIDGGRRLEMVVPDNARRLRVAAGRDSDGGVFELGLAQRNASESLKSVTAHIGAREYAEALALIERSLASVAQSEHTDLLRQRGRILLRQGHTDAAQKALYDSIAAGLEAGPAGYHYSMTLAASALAFSLIHVTRDFGAAREALHSLPFAADGHAEVAYFRNHYLGLVAFNSGDARNALRYLDDAARHARRVGWNRRALNSESILALQLQQLGRREQASALLEGWRERIPDDLPDCHRALYYTNLGWSALLTLDAGEAARDPSADLETALRLSDRHCSANERVNARINLALARYHATRLDAAVELLGEARELTAQPELRMVLWSEDIAARIALERQDFDEALKGYARLDTLAAATLSPSARWRAAIGRARALTAMGDNARALAAFAAAETQLRSDLLRVPLDGGRETLLATRSAAERYHLALLLDTGRDQEAFDLVRRGHSRALRSVHLPQRLASLPAARRALWDSAIADYRQLGADINDANSLSWMLPADELTRRKLRREEGTQRLRAILDDAVSALEASGFPETPALELKSGELYLHFAPLPDGYALFDYDGMTLTVTKGGCEQTDPLRTATCLLERIAPRLDDSDSLRVAASGVLAPTDLHALAIAGQPLAARLPLVYAVGLPRSAITHLPQRRALLIADPRNDLRQARREVASVEKMLRSSGQWSAEVVSGEAARAPDVLTRLGESDLFHYAGHARFAGDAGWRSTLALAGDSRLDVADILALGRAPALVVLSGCETAGGQSAAIAQHFGLAHAFLAGGAESVIATSRPVADRSAFLLVDEFYRALTGGEPVHIAFNKAQQSLRTQHADPDWAAFRLMGP